MDGIDKVKKTFFVVEIGSADFYFDKLHEASEFFAKIVSSTARSMGRLGYGSDAYHFEEGKPMPSMKQEILDVYPTRKAAEFAKSTADSLKTDE